MLNSFLGNTVLILGVFLVTTALGYRAISYLIEPRRPDVLPKR